MSTTDTELLEGLRAATRRSIPNVSDVQGLTRLSGGASQEMWAFDAIAGDETVPLIVRRAPGGATVNETGFGKVSLETEAHLLGLASAAGVPVPRVRHVFDAQDALGSGFMMERIEGETIARKIIRDEKYVQVRPKLARQCGEILAGIHRIPIDTLQELDSSPAPIQLEQFRKNYDGYDYPHPVFELAFRWLEERMIDVPEPRFVHGDFRNGNLIIGTDGVRAVLDWELAHLGDPMEDLGWICTNSWRFGSIDLPVGGFGEREDLFRGYEEAGGVVDPVRVHFWEVFGSLKWGIMCMSMYSVYRSGADRSVERAAIGRRSSEAEIDLMNLLTGEN
ncbi:MAG: phosphotransferase family protein [Candidatus Hydrogenedentes bacterium]|nr:phosphotransferase family protein [Candidatus Hydrogenedentota bacterium]